MDSEHKNRSDNNARDSQKNPININVKMDRYRSSFAVNVIHFFLSKINLWERNKSIYS
jgi:hypothetical protein